MGSALGQAGQYGASLGITNMKQKTFDRVKREFPAQFSGIEWSDLAGNDDLSLKATSYYLKSLQKNEVANAPTEVKNNYSPLQVMAGIYNVGEQNYLESAYANGKFGPVGTSYLNRMFKDGDPNSKPDESGFFGTATLAICGSRIFTCSH